MSQNEPHATTPRGSVRRDDDGVHLIFERTYDHSVEHLWAALTDPQQTARWIGAWSGDPQSGIVQLTMSSEEGAAAEEVHIDACEPGHRLALTMGGAETPWPVEVTVAERSGGAHLTFVHHLAEQFDASSIGPGWQFYLDRLGASVAGQPAPEDFALYHPALADHYRVPAPTS